VDQLRLLWLFFIVVSLQPFVQREILAARRRERRASLSGRREATVITLLHRQETMSLLGFPVVRSIDIDAESVGALSAAPWAAKPASSTQREYQSSP
jgi:Serine dehydrogenase proteinase